MWYIELLPDPNLGVYHICVLLCRMLYWLSWRLSNNLLMLILSGDHGDLPLSDTQDAHPEVSHRVEMTRIIYYYFLEGVLRRSFRRIQTSLNRPRTQRPARQQLGDLCADVHAYILIFLISYITTSLYLSSISWSILTSICSSYEIKY